MEWYTALITIIGLFFVFLVLGIPVNYSLGLSFIPILLFLSDEPASYVFNLFGMMTFRKLNSIVLVAVPLFILMGQIFCKDQYRLSHVRRLPALVELDAWRLGCNDSIEQYFFCRHLRSKHDCCRHNWPDQHS